jgi:hypothetical protein
MQANVATREINIERTYCLLEMRDWCRCLNEVPQRRRATVLLVKNTQLMIPRPIVISLTWCVPSLRLLATNIPKPDVQPTLRSRRDTSLDGRHMSWFFKLDLEFAN